MANENMNTPTVTIELPEYRGLIHCVADFENLRKALYESAKLNYNSTGLRFDDEWISMILRVIDGDGYERKFAELKASEEEA